MNGAINPVPVEVINSAVTGDRDAFALIYRTYQPLVLNYVRHRASAIPIQTCEDITSEVFERALKNIHRYQHRDRDIGAWLVTIARNRIADFYKSAQWRRQELTECDVVDSQTLPIDQALRGEMSRTIHTALADLPLSQQQVLVLRFLRGLSLNETAAALTIDPNTVKARQHRACRALARRGDISQLRPE